MRHEYNTVSEALPGILKHLDALGDEVGSRNGRALELLNQQIVIRDPSQREVLSIGRKANVFAQIAETCWVLAGRNDIEWLSAYLPRAVEFSDDGKTWRGGYGPRIRRWSGRDEKDLRRAVPVLTRTEIDQLAHVIETLKADPLSRRAVISIYDPTIDIPAGKDVPCNDFLQFLSRKGRLHLTVTVRSNDVMWGWSGINFFEWSVLQEIVASLLGVQVGTLTFNVGSMHLYERHWDKARKIEYERPHALLRMKRFNPDGLITDLEQVDTQLERFFNWESMCRQGTATRDLLMEWEDPMFKGWAAAIAYYWQRDEQFRTYLDGTMLGVAVGRSPSSVLPEPVQRPSEPASVPVAPTTTPAFSDAVRGFYDFVVDLHAKKHASYGDSWKKRGEKLSILANIARKVDRLGVGDEFDSSADTFIDLWVYLAKYICWLDGEDAGPSNVNSLLWVSLEEAENMGSGAAGDVENLVGELDGYMNAVDAYSIDMKLDFVTRTINRVAPYARDLWLAENTDGYTGADHD